MKWLRALLHLRERQPHTARGVDDVMKRTDAAVARAEQTIHELDDRRRYLEAVRRSYEESK